MIDILIQNFMQIRKKLFLYFQIGFFNFKQQDLGISLVSITQSVANQPPRAIPLLALLIQEYGLNQIVLTIKVLVPSPKSGRVSAKAVQISLVISKLSGTVNFFTILDD